MDDLDAGVLFVVESASERVAEDQDVDAGPFEIPLVVQEEFLFPARRTCGQLLLRLALALILPGLALTLALILTGLHLTLQRLLTGGWSLGLGKTEGERGQSGRDEQGTRADVHADDPYLAESIAIGLRLPDLMGFSLTNNISVRETISSEKTEFLIPFQALSKEFVVDHHFLLAETQKNAGIVMESGG